MRLVDGEEGDLLASDQLIEQANEALAQQPLRRDVDQVQLPAQQRRSVSTSARKSCDELRKAARTPPAQGVDLVLHQRDQGETTTPTPSQQCRDLIAERLAAAGRHQHQRVAAATSWSTISACWPRNEGSRKPGAGFRRRARSSAAQWSRQPITNLDPPAAEPKAGDRCRRRPAQRKTAVAARHQHRRSRLSCLPFQHRHSPCVACQSASTQRSTWMPSTRWSCRSGRCVCPWIRLA
jgi:hypothetical protein